VASQSVVVTTTQACWSSIACSDEIVAVPVPLAATDRRSSQCVPPSDVVTTDQHGACVCGAAQVAPFPWRWRSAQPRAASTNRRSTNRASGVGKVANQVVPPSGVRARPELIVAQPTSACRSWIGPAMNGTGSGAAAEGALGATPEPDAPGVRDATAPWAGGGSAGAVVHVISRSAHAAAAGMDLMPRPYECGPRLS